VESSYIQKQFSSLSSSYTQGFNGTYTNLVWDANLKNAFAIHFFYLLWVTEFLVYFTYLVIAGAIATWYFTRYDQSGAKNLPPNMVYHSSLRACRFHLGSIALGSMILAIIQFIRAVLKYLELQTKKASPNRIQIIIFRLLQCCLGCVECCCDKVNKNGFVWMGVYGDAFVPSVCNSFQLIWNNLFRLAAVELVGEYMLVCGKIIVSLLSTGICGLIIKGIYDTRVSSIVMPCLLVFLIGYFVASVFMNLFETAIDTIFLCFLIDEEANKESGQMYASKSLKDLIDAHSATSREMHEQELQFRNQKQGTAMQAVTLPPPSQPTAAPQSFVGGPTSSPQGPVAGVF